MATKQGAVNSLIGDLNSLTVKVMLQLKGSDVLDVGG